MQEVTEMNDKQVAYALITAAILLAAAAITLFVLVSVPELLAISNPVDACFALEKQSDCRDCCVGTGMGKGECARACAHAKHVSSSGL